MTFMNKYWVFFAKISPMIIEFKFSNYRSYKDEVGFSMEADASKQKGNNIFETELISGQSIKYLKTSVIYGANASGKTNVIRAMHSLFHYILFKPKVDERIRLYDPFKFDSKSEEEPSTFELTFIGPKKCKYHYKISINRTTVLSEELNYYPKNKVTNLFSRNTENAEGKIHIGILGDSLDKKRINVFENQLLLSKFGDDEPNGILTDVFIHFQNYFVFNATNQKHYDDLLVDVNKELFNNEVLKRKVSILLQQTDTKISDIRIHQFDNASIEKLNPAAQAAIRKSPYRVYSIHNVLSKDSQKDIAIMDFLNESRGSQMLYTFGGKMLSTLEKGGVLVVDELDTSLHPFITKLIVMIFQSPVINKLGAQLIFTTHDVSLLNEELLRKDQIWFAEKSDTGISQFYSLQDFDGLREDTPFEKWYLAGKFGAIPNIQSIENIFADASNI